MTTSLFARLLYLDERPAPGRAAWNMAMDEAILRTATAPVLRVYAWDRAAVSFGYFITAAEARAACIDGAALVRRWTGGGIVPHGEDLTWSLIVPAQEPFFLTKPAASYMRLHGICAEVMSRSGIPAEQIPETVPAPEKGLCFTQPAPGDLVSGGQKIAGAGQRRTRQGLLHQASLCGVPLPEEFCKQLAAALAPRAEPWTPGTEVLHLAAELEQSRYGTVEWTERV
jgi:lipoyl(octanoyl) transferase